MLVAAIAAITLVAAAAPSQTPAPSPLPPTPSSTPTDPLAGGPLRFTLEAFFLEGEGYRPMAGTEFDIAVTNGSASATVVTTGATGQVSFEVTVMEGHAAALLEITEIAQSDYPLDGASCWYDGQPLLDWSPRPDFTVEVQPGWDAGCTFYHRLAVASPNPTPRLTPPPTDTGAVAPADGMPVVPVMLLLLAIPVIELLRRRRRGHAVGD